MATPKKTKNGYTAHVYLGKVDGKRIYASITAPTQREWKLAEAQAKLQFKEHQARGSSPTIDEAVTAYIESRSNILSPTTIAGYLKIQRNNIERIKDKRCDEITSSNLQAWCNELAARLKAKTVSNAVGLVLAALDMQNPDKRYHFTRPKKEVKTYNTPDDEEVKALINDADSELKKAIMLSAFGTLRRGEICGLRYSDILYDMNAVYVHAVRVLDQYNCWIHKDRPKNDSSVRTVIYPKEVILLLDKGHPDDYVVSLTPNQVTWRFGRLAKRLGMKCTFHELRHYAASIMHAIGIPDQYIMERGGWKTDSTLKTVYRNSLKDKNIKFTKITNTYTKELLSRMDA